MNALSVKDWCRTADLKQILSTSAETEIWHRCFSAQSIASPASRPPQFLMAETSILDIASAN